MSNSPKEPQTFRRLQIVGEDFAPGDAKAAALINDRENERKGNRAKRSPDATQNKLVKRFNKLGIFDPEFLELHVATDKPYTFTEFGKLTTDMWYQLEVSPELLIVGSPGREALKQAIAIVVDKNWERLQALGNTDKKQVAAEFMAVLVKVSEISSTIRIALKTALNDSAE